MLPILGFIAKQILSLYTALAAHVPILGFIAKSRSCRSIRHLWHTDMWLWDVFLSSEVAVAPSQKTPKGPRATNIMSNIMSGLCPGLCPATLGSLGVFEDFVSRAIFATCATCGLFGDSLQSRSCRYMQYLRHMRRILGFIARQILLLYAVLAAHAVHSRGHCKAGLVASAAYSDKYCIAA